MYMCDDHNRPTTGLISLSLHSHMHVHIYIHIYLALSSSGIVESPDERFQMMCIIKPDSFLSCFVLIIFNYLQQHIPH